VRLIVLVCSTLIYLSAVVPGVTSFIFIPDKVGG